MDLGVPGNLVGGAAEPPICACPPPVDGALRVIGLPGNFIMHRGGVLPSARLAFECWGELSPARDNVVVVFTGLSPTAHAASSPQDSEPGWWEYAIGPGRPIDTDRYFVICFNSLGGCFGSTGPASINPDTGEPYRLAFPDLSVEDIAASARDVLAIMGVHRVRSVVGASLGGMVALAWAVKYPGSTDSLVSISAAARAQPYAIAIRSLQREMIRSDPDWQGGRYTSARPPIQGTRPQSRPHPLP